MKFKFEKYWDSIERVNELLLLLSIIFDPRLKMQYLTFCFGRIYDESMIFSVINEVKEILVKIFDMYAKMSGSLDPINRNDLQSDGHNKNKTSDKKDDTVDLFLNDHFLKHMEEKQV